MMTTMQKGILLTIGLLLACASAVAEVYKTVDEDGNVVFTDQQPTPDAQPIQMRGLTVVPIPEPTTPKPIRARPGQGDERGQVTDLGALRRGYRDFRLVQPLPEQAFSGTGNTATVAWETRFALQEGMAVVVSIDGQDMPPTTDPVVATEWLDRGQHTASATLVDSQGRTIATAQPVTFYIRQWSRLFNQQQGAAASGG